MTVRVYKSDDVDAPVLSGVVGSIIDVLDACLVNGYTGKPAAGWTKEFSGTNTAVYRGASGLRHYLRVQHTTAQYPSLRGYVSMTDINTGTRPFPTTAQLPAGITPVVSSTASAIERPWVIVANARALYLWVGFGFTVLGEPTTSADVTFFGEIVSYLNGDDYGTAIVGKTTQDTTVGSTRLCQSLTPNGVDSLGHYLASSYLHDGNSILCGALQSLPANSPQSGNAGTLFPDPVTGGLLLDRVRICEGGAAMKLVRGHFPGMFNPLHLYFNGHLSTFEGRGDLLGVDLLLLYKGGTVGLMAFALDESLWHG